ncbi:MAG: portal protein, partial [Hyphomicrobium sp.]
MAGELAQAALDVPQGKISKAESAAVVKEARERLEAAWAADKDNRQEAATDLKFLAGDQWPEHVRKEREAEGRPILTINALPQFLRQVTNPIREADLSIKTAPVDSKSDPKVAQIYDGILKQIQYQSSAKAVYAQTCEHQSACGIGWFQIVTAYVDDTVFDQEIRIEGIRSPLAVYDDPAAAMPDRSDSMWRLICEMIPQATFKAKYPKASTAGIDKPSDGAESTLFWSDNDMVRVAHYWRKVPEKKTLGMLQTGETIDCTGMSKVVKTAMGIVKERECESYRVEMFVVSGQEVLEGPYQWPGKFLPQVPVIGSEIPVEKGVYRYGVIRFARDPQQLYNYNRTGAAESIALAPKVPYVATAKQIEGREQEWYTANSKARSVLIYKPDPAAASVKPERERQADVPVAYVNEALAAAEDMKRTTGIYDASLGGKSNETSGVAINQRQIQGDTATYHYGDNLQRSLEHCGRVLIDLIPKVYDNERVIRILGDDDAEDFVPINQVVMGQDGMPVMVNDLSVGRFDVRVRIGRSADTKRLETADSMFQFMQAFPDAAPLIADLVAKNSDWPGADEIAKRLKNMVPPQALIDPDDPNAPPPPDPTQDPAFQLEAAEKQAKTEKDAQTARKTAAEAEMQEFENVMAMGQAQAGIHPMQQDPLQEKQFDAE